MRPVRTLASNSTRTAFGGLDLWANWHQFPEFQIKVGQYKAPFGFEQLSSDTKLFTLERSQVTSALTPERQIGVQIWGKPFANVFPEQKDLLTYYAGIFNGNGRNITVNDNDEYMFAGRLEMQPWKGKISEAEAWLKFGANALSSRDASGTVLSPAGTLRVNSDGSLSTFTAPSAAERTGYGFDALFHLGPFDLIGEYLSESYEARTVTALPLFRISARTAITSRAATSSFRRSSNCSPSTKASIPGRSRMTTSASITGGLNYYIHGDDIKIMAHYIHTWSDFRKNNPAFGQDEFDQVMLRLQLIY